MIFDREQEMLAELKRRLAQNYIPKPGVVARPLDPKQPADRAYTGILILEEALRRLEDDILHRSET